MGYKFDLTEKQFALLARLLVESGALEIDRLQRNKLMEMLRGVQLLSQGESVDFNTASSILSLLTVVLDDVTALAKDLKCDPEDLTLIATSICLQLQSQHMDNWKVR